MKDEMNDAQRHENDAEDNIMSIYPNAFDYSQKLPESALLHSGRHKKNVASPLTAVTMNDTRSPMSIV